MLLGLAVISVGAESWSALSAKLLAVVPFLAPFRVWRATAYEAADAPRSISSPRARSIIRGTPAVRAGHHHPFCSAWKRGSRNTLGHRSRLRVASGLVVPTPIALLRFPALDHTGRQFDLVATDRREPPQHAGAGSSRRSVSRSSGWCSGAQLLCSGFLSCYRSPTSFTLRRWRSNSGVTFAEYARRGFGELSFAATIVGAIILILEYTRPADATERDRKMLVRLELVLLVALELVLVSAFRRVMLYEQAYGFTTARLFAQAYMVVMSLSLIALAIEVARGSISIAFGRRVAEIALGVFTVLVFWNYEAWIVNRNIDRAVQDGKFDAYYAGRLSRDAIPTLVSRRAELPADARAVVEARLACARLPAERRWFEWNRSVRAADRALRSWNRTPCFRTPPPQAPDTSLTTSPRPSAGQASRAASSAREE